MWEKLGLDWFSTGFYAYTDKPGDLLEIKVNNRYRTLFSNIKIKKKHYSGDGPHSFNYQKNLVWTGLPTTNKIFLSEKFANEFDVFVFQHFVDSIYDNLRLLKGKTIILQTYAMHNIEDEARIQHLRETIGLKVVRNSFTEYKRKKYCGHDAIIHGSVVKDENEISGWTGLENKVSTFTSYMTGGANRYKLYTDVVKEVKIPCELFGVKNEPVGKFISHKEKINVLQNYRISLLAGTPNATNTYSMVESWIMGQPIVAFGKEMWNSDTYELYELIEHGKTGFIGETTQECANYINLLSQDMELCKEISKNQREKAISIYGREVLAQKWREFFKELGYEV